MAEKFVRIYKRMDIEMIKQHMLIYGDLSAQCANCQMMDLKLEDRSCSKCNTEFKYISFRNIKNHLPKLQKINESDPSIQFIDHDDFKHHVSAMKARDFLK